MIGRVVVGIEKLKGKKKLRILSVHSHPNEVYHFHTSNGGQITLHCVEKVYVLSYEAWWAAQKVLVDYYVYGTCDSKIPMYLAERLNKGINLGPILPSFASRKDQKKAVIHAYASLVVDELERQSGY